MKQNTRRNRFRPQKFIALIFLLTIFGCGGGGNGIIESGVSRFRGINPDPDSVNTRSASLAWQEPATNIDGSQLTDLAGYKVYYGKSSHTYTHSVDVGTTTGASISSLSADTWCFAVTAYDVAGNESDFSEEVCI